MPISGKPEAVISEGLARNKKVKIGDIIASPLDTGTPVTAPVPIRLVGILRGPTWMAFTSKKFTDAKIVTHGINFDVDRATLRPESMGVLNQIKSVMAADPTLTFEVDGFTDNSGASAHNQALSQQRADAVKSQLVTMGVDAGRLTTKGYGDTKPMDTNDTMEGKANNRRVEFLRTSAASST